MLSMRPPRRIVSSSRGVVFCPPIAILFIWFVTTEIGFSDSNTDPLLSIISSVRESELLYENLDVMLEKRYVLEAKVLINKVSPTCLKQSTTHFVAQSGKFRVDRTGITTNTTIDKGKNIDRIRAFDGATTRLLEQRQVANIIDGRMADDTFVWPNMLLFQHLNCTYPLSVLLSGSSSIAAYPGVNTETVYPMSVSYVRDEALDGIKCAVVDVETLVDGSPHNRMQVWLARERNYLPAKVLCFVNRLSQVDPVNESNVNEWKEIAPGIWFPIKGKTIALNSWQPEKLKVKEVLWTDEFSVSNISLNPKYDERFFSDVPIPDGVAVYKIEQQKIKQSYVQGAPKRVANISLSTPVTRWWLLWINLAFMAAVIIGVVYRSRLKRRSPSAPVDP